MTGLGVKIIDDIGLRDKVVADINSNDDDFLCGLRAVDLSEPYLNIEKNDYGGIDTSFVYGINRRFPNSYEPPEMVYDSRFLDMINAFKNDDYVTTNKKAKECFDYTLVVSKQESHYGLVKKSEANLEYSVLNENLIPFEKFDLINPSSGTLARLANYGQLKRVGKVWLIEGSHSSYLDRMSSKNEEFKTEMEIVSVGDLNRDGYYYLSFNGVLGKKIGLKNYFGYEVNPYALARNGLLKSFRGGVDGIACGYDRQQEDRVNVSFFREDDRKIYGSDFLHGYFMKTRGYIKTSPAYHDIVSTVDIPFGRNDVRIGNVNTAHAYCLIGNYTHDRDTIHGEDGKIVFVNTPLIGACSKLDHKWKLMSSSGESFWKASYVKPLFSSDCVFLGKKFFFRRQRPSEDNYDWEEDGVKYVEINPGGHKIDLILSTFDGKKKYKGHLVSVCPKLPIVSSIQMMFNNSEYCHGTYQTLSFDAKVVESVSDVLVRSKLSKAVSLTGFQCTPLSDLINKEDNRNDMGKQ